MLNISQQFLTEKMKKQIDTSLGHHALQMVEIRAYSIYSYG